MAPSSKGVNFKLAKFASKCDMFLDSNVLVAKNQNLMIKPRLFNFFNLIVGDISEVDA